MQTEAELQGNGKLCPTEADRDENTAYPAGCWDEVEGAKGLGLRDKLLQEGGPLSATVVIKCLSFDPVQDGCAASPCG